MQCEVPVCFTLLLEYYGMIMLSIFMLHKLFSEAFLVTLQCTSFQVGIS